MLPFSEACERNKGPILEVLRARFADRSQVLEIGSGTGQHAVYFAAHLTHLTWHPTERLGYLADLAARILAQEHRCYPRAITLWAQGRIQIEDRRVRIAGAAGDPARTLSSPELLD